MTPTGPRNHRRQLAKTAYQLRCQGRTWDDIADTLGYGSSAAACKAVTRHINRMPPEETTMARALSAGNYRIVIGQLHSIANEANNDGKPDIAIRALQAVADVQDRHDKLIGIQAATTTKVDVTVHQTAEAVIERAEAELLALAGEQPAIPAPAVGLPVLDAEIIDMPASGPSESVPQPITPEEA